MKVLNYGSLNLDYVYHVNHMVENGETILSTSMEVNNGGKGLNQSIALAKAGVKVYHAGAIGRDGKQLLEVLRLQNVDTRYVKCTTDRTGHAIIQVDESGNNSIILFGGANQSIDLEDVKDVLADFLADDYLLLQNEINGLSTIIDLAYDKGMKVVLNPSPCNNNIFACDLNKVTYLLLNEVEGRQLTQKEEPMDILDALIRQYPNLKIVLTLGSEGSMYKDSSCVLKQACVPCDVVDTTAAGDTFTGYFMASILENKSIEEALNIASKASSIACSRKGASDSIPKMTEVD